MFEFSDFEHTDLSLSRSRLFKQLLILEIDFSRSLVGQPTNEHPLRGASDRRRRFDLLPVLLLG